MKERGERPQGLSSWQKVILAPFPLVMAGWAVLAKEINSDLFLGLTPIAEIGWLILIAGIPNSGSKSELSRELGNSNSKDDKKDPR